MDRVLAILVDVAPVWMWKPANIRWIGSRTLHFCYRDGHRTVEFESRVLLAGHRQRAPRSDAATGRHTD
jgi:hypothetical protein